MHLLASLRSFVPALLVGAGLSACQPAAGARGGPSSTLDHQGQALLGEALGFYFLPPIAPDRAFTGTFDADRDATVIVDEIAADGTPFAQVATFSRTTGPGSETVRVDPGCECYVVDFHTDLFDLRPDRTYRIRVVDPLRELGFADLDVVGSGRELKNVDTDEYVPLLDGRTLPIKFRIERREPPGGTHLWSRALANPESASADHVAADPTGNAIVIGTFRGAADLGGGPLTGSGQNSNVFVAKFAPDGTHLWSRGFGGAGFGWNHGFTVAADVEGNVVAAGAFSGTVDWGCGARQVVAYQDAYVVKYSPSGACLWSLRIGGSGWNDVASAAVDPWGNVVASGFFSSAIEIGAVRLDTGSAHTLGTFLAKLAPDGTVLWAKGFCCGAELNRTVATDGAGNIVLAGHVGHPDRAGGSVDFGGGPLVSTHVADVFVAKFAPDGAHLWSRRFPGPGGDEVPTGLAVAPGGDLLLAGHFAGSVDFGGGLLASAADGSRDAFLVRLSASGDHVWSRRLGEAGDQLATSVGIDPRGNLLLSGSFQHALALGAAALSSAGSADAFVAKLAPDGTPLWSRGYGDGSYQTANAVAADRAGDVIVAGNFLGALDLGGGPFASAGSWDGFVAKLAGGGEER